MNIDVKAVRRRGALVLKVQVTEDHYGYGPFIKGVAEGKNDERCFELCFHRGHPQGEPRSGRMVQFEHVVREVPGFVRTIHIRTGPDQVITIHSQSTFFQPAPRGKRAG